MDTLSKFEYLSGVVNETLRLYAPATATERTASKDIELENVDGSLKLSLKKGDIIHFPIYSMHRDERQFPDAESFRPERFLVGDDGQLSFHKYSYLPFGQGSYIIKMLLFCSFNVILLFCLCPVQDLGIA